MSRHDFESQLSARFNESTMLPDDAAFLARVDAALVRARRRRRLVLIGSGLSGGVLTSLCLGRMDVQRDAIEGMRSLLAPVWHAMGQVTTASWSASAIVIAVLLLPVLMRAVIDPK